jgi:hypothetical protein
MSRFGNHGTFYYDPYGTIGPTGGTFLYLNAGQMPQYPFVEQKITDKLTLRNLGGRAFSYKNYAKQRYTFRWTFLDESKANEFRNMFNAAPALSWNTGGAVWGTFFIEGDPVMSEVQHELFDLEMTLEET